MILLSITGYGRRLIDEDFPIYLFQRFRLIMIRQGVNHCADVAIEKIIEIIAGHVDTMIGDAALGKIVCADTLAAIAAAHLIFSGFRHFRVLFLYHGIEQARAQYLHCFDLVFKLRFFILTGNNKPCR